MAAFVHEAAVVGGGAVGLALLRLLCRALPSSSARSLAPPLVLLDKEKVECRHQTGHNSGVIHAGIYYAPGSLRATLCAKGASMMYAFCEERGIPHQRIGKLIVATRSDGSEGLERLEQLHERGVGNGVDGLELLSANALHSVEPLATGGAAALWSPNTGIVDYAEVGRHMRAEAEEGGKARILFDAHVSRLRHTRVNGERVVAIQTCDGQQVFSRRAFVCAGLHSDVLARASGVSSALRIIPVRGEYLQMRQECYNMVRHLIYPVPNPEYPFLGVHFTPMMRGGVWIGPNAVLALAREGYNYSDIELETVKGLVAERGLRRLLMNNVSFGIGEITRSLWREQQLKRLREYMPSLAAQHLRRETVSGVRAIAVDQNGAIFEDFAWGLPGQNGEEADQHEREENDEGAGAPLHLHVLNAPSPAATSCLAIAEHVLQYARSRLGWSL